MFRNTGSQPWDRVAPGEEAPFGVVLQSVDRGGRIVPSGAVGEGWFGDPVVTSLGRDVARVAPGSPAIFTFHVQIPEDAEAGPRAYYFMPVAQALGPRPDACWGEARFEIEVRPRDCGECATGEVEREPCGRCGVRRRRCDDCRWGAWSACGSQGACVPGVSQACETACGRGTRGCSDHCTWSACGGPEAGVCNPLDLDRRACSGEDEGRCDPGHRQRRCGDACRWEGWGECAGVVDARRERFDERDDDCDGEVDELWRPLVRCAREGVFRFRDAPGGGCFDGWAPDNHGRPYFYVHKAEDGEPLPLTSRLFNDWHDCRGQLLSFNETPADDGVAGWRDSGAIWYAVAPDHRDEYPETVAVYRLYKDVPECGRRYLFLPEGQERDAALQAGWALEHGEAAAFYAWPARP